MAEYISREKAIDAVKQATGLGNTAFCDKWDAMNRLRLVPAADVCPHYHPNKHDRGDDSYCDAANCEVKAVQPVRRGRWQGEADDYADGELMWSCSFCGNRFAEWYQMPDWNYCPNCGARMDGAK